MRGIFRWNKDRILSYFELFSEKVIFFLVACFVF